MKLFNAAVSLGALCAVSEAVSIRSQQSINNFDFEALNQRLENLKELDSNLVHRVPAHKQELVAQRLQHAAQFSIAAQSSGNNNWWGWWFVAVIDAAQDLAFDIVQDVGEWVDDAADGVGEFVDGVMNDIEGFIGDAVEDIGEWGDHLANGDLFEEIGEDMIGWIDDVK